MSKPTAVYRTISHARITKVAGVEKVKAIRLYCEQADAAWALQVRGPLMRADGRESANYIVATATLFREDMEALRDSIVEALNVDERDAAALLVSRASRFKKASMPGKEKPK